MELKRWATNDLHAADNLYPTRGKDQPVYQKETTMNGLKRMKLLNVLTCLLLPLYLVALVAPATATAQSNPTPVVAQSLAAIDAYLLTQRQELRIPGLALGIVHGHQIVHLKGFGIADLGGQAVTAQTPFILNSICKSFAPLAIMQRVEADRIELDAPVERYLPWFRVADANASTQSRAVTSNRTENRNKPIAEEK
jgi:CubicO group peptidase (beta-lactamase class C family)